MALIKPSSPIINWGHPLTSGLVFDMPAFEGIGDPMDIVTNKKGSNNSGVSWIKSIFGNALSYDGSTGKTSFTTVSFQNSLSYSSLQVICYPINKTSGGGFPRIFHKGPNARGYLDFSLDNGAAGFSWQGEYTGGTSAGAVGTTSITLSSWYNVICISNGSHTGTDWRRWENGVEPSLSAVNGTDPRNSDSTALAIGGRTIDTNRCFTGYVALVRYWNRILTPNEVWSLYTNPWQIYQQPKRIVNYSASATNITVNADVVSSALSLPAPSVTAIKNASTASDVVTTTSSLPSPTITTTRFETVAPSEITQALTLPDPAITAKRFVSSTADVVTTTLSLSAPTITGITNASTLADILLSTITLPSPTVTTTRTISLIADLLDLSATLPAPTVTTDVVLDATVSVDVLSLNSSLPTPTTYALGYIRTNSPFYYKIFSDFSIRLGPSRLSEWNEAGRPVGIQGATGHNIDNETLEHYDGESWLSTALVGAITNVTIGADLVNLTSSLPDPTITTVENNVNIGAGVINITPSLPAPTITTIKNISVSSDVVTLPSSLPSPTVTPVRNVSTASDVVTVSSSLPNPTVSIISSKSRSITIDHTKVGSSSHSDFPILFSGTYAYLATEANGGNVKHASGYDIRFFSDSGLTTALKFQRVSWNATTGESQFRIKIPSLSSSVDTVIYMSYGDSGVSIDQQDASNTWNSNFEYVGNLEGNSNDSSSNGYNGTDTSITYGTTYGKYGQGANLANSGNRINLGDQTNLHTVAFSYTIWYKPSSFPNAYNCIMGSEAATNVQYNTFYVLSSGKLAAYLYGVTSFDGTGATTLSTGTWYMLTLTYDSTNGLKAYVNTTLDKSNAANGDAQMGGTAMIGTQHNYETSRDIRGDIDMPRFLSIAISADWVTAQYNNENDPSTFYTISNEL